MIPLPGFVDSQISATVLTIPERHAKKQSALQAGGWLDSGRSDRHSAVVVEAPAARERKLLVKPS
jgi:hypothetical protein